MDFDHILNWQLKRGSHEFPGPNGGTCINEAAIVAAGFEYRRVKSWKDCPPCFSPVLSAFAIVVNDWLDNSDRRSLLPLVTRLSGSADSRDWIDVARAEFILREMERAVFQPVLPMLRGRLYDGRLYDQIADSIQRCYLFVADDPTRAMQILGEELIRLSEAFDHIGPIAWIRRAQLPMVTPYVDEAITQITVETCQMDRRALWRAAAVALERAFEIGNRALPIETAKVVERMEAEKAKALERV